MCVIHCARHEVTGRELAIKVLREEFANDDAARKRLIREAQTLESSRGPYVVELLDASFLENGRPYLVLEMLEGRTLDGILAARRLLPPADAVNVGIHLCRALSQVHAKSIVHRDVKPSNLIVVRTLRGETIAKLIDFGIASPVVPAAGPTGRAAAKVTKPGEFFGTPEYVAPEAVQEPDVLDRRSDIFATGITLFECLAGDVPYSGGFAAVAFKVMTAGVPDIRTRRPEVPESLASVLARAVAANPSDRFAHPKDMQGALEQVRRELGSAADQDDPQAQQRRKHQRCTYVTPVQVKLPGFEPILGRSEDISKGGLLVVASQRCPDNTPVEIKFMTPLTGSIVTVSAVTRWVRSARDRSAIGLEFRNLPEVYRTEIAQFAGQVFLSP